MTNVAEGYGPGAVLAWVLAVLGALIAVFPVLVAGLIPRGWPTGLRPLAVGGISTALAVSAAVIAIRVSSGVSAKVWVPAVVVAVVAALIGGNWLALGVVMTFAR